MGQRISAEMRERIRRRPGVCEITEEHIILASGEPVDPSQFVVEERPVRFVAKLSTCGCCWFRGHRSGMHVLVRGFVDVFADGRHVRRFVPPTECPHGNWLIEEVIPSVACGPAS